MSYTPEFLEAIARMTAAQRLAEQRQAEGRQRIEQDQLVRTEQLTAKTPERNEQVTAILQMAENLGDAALARELTPGMQIAARRHWWSRSVVQYAGWALTPIPRYHGEVMRKDGRLLGVDRRLYAYTFYRGNRGHNDGFHILIKDVMIDHEVVGEGEMYGTGEDAYWAPETTPTYADETVTAITADVLAGQIDRFNELGARDGAHPYLEYTELLARFAFDNQLVTA